MATTRYVRFSDGVDTDGGTTWADARQTLTGIAAIDTSGDTIFVSDNHNESTAGAVTLAFAGTSASPTRILCADDAAEPPTALALTGTVTTTGSNAITITGNVYVYGLQFISGNGIKLATSVTPSFQTYEKCDFHFLGNSTSQVGPANTTNQGTKVRLLNCNFKPLGTTSGINFTGVVEIIGGTFLSGSSAVTTAFALWGADRTHSEILISGMDFTNAGVAQHIFGAGSGGSARGIVRNCKLQASWSGVLVTGTLAPGQRFEMYNCDNADTNYRLWIEDYAGSIKSETTIVRTGGASDGTTPLAWKMVTSANSSHPTVPLRSGEIVKWNETTGSAITATIEIVHDTNVAGGQGAGASYAFQDDEVWLEVEYLSDASYPLGSFVSDTKADVLATAADQTSSSETWTTTGLTTPVKQKLSVTFTPQSKGYIHARVCVGKASKTVYVDPLITIA